jgi:hypothetical protein
MDGTQTRSPLELRHTNHSLQRNGRVVTGKSDGARRAGWLAIGPFVLLSGCATPTAFSIPPATSVIPSSAGTPNSVVSFGNYEFVSVQGTGQIFTYNISSGSQVLAGTPYTTPCADPSGMVVATIAGNNVMAVACYDGNSLLTLTVNSNGSLSPLGSVGGLAMPYPGIVLDGTNVLVALFGGSSTNGTIAKVSIASPANPVVEGIVTLAGPASGGFSNGGYLAVAGGYIYATAGSESAPQSSSSTIQVVNETSMALVGSPLVVAHSPQQIVVQGHAAYVTLFDAAQLESIDISDPASLQPLQILSLTAGVQNFHPIPLIVRESLAYAGCFSEGVIDQLDISNPSRMQPTMSLGGINYPQRMAFAGNSLLATGASTGGPVYAINLSEF